MSQQATVCNLGNTGVGRRRMVGWVALAAGLGLAAGLWWSGLPALWRLAAFPILWIAMLGLFQAQARTCVRLAAQGVKDLDDGRGPTPIEDTAERAAIAQVVRRIHTRSLLAAIVLTAIAVAVPVRGAY